MSKRGLLIIYTGPSGCGKGTVMAKFLPKNPETRMSVSCTTRAPRQGEIDGVHYFYITREKFEAMIAENAFLEYAEYAGNYYGTPKAWVDEQLEQGNNVVLEIEVQGALNVMKQRPDALSVFLLPPCWEELERRLRGRGTEAEEVILRRLEAAKWELQQKDHYRFQLINDDVDETVAALERLIEDEKSKIN
ncbi:MAG: guanylate kinase [Clostridia bacterium]|nr:guanylate kinase [Clostridia bacterium]MBQ2939416.1 guanylate kinase [Clostridia bacterium]